MIKIKYTANILTVSRIIVSIIILCLSPLSIEFYICYILCGISDIFDGFIARKTHTESKFGAFLDSIADFVMLITVGIVLSPILLNLVPYSIWWITIAIVIIKISGYIIVVMKFKKFISFHTYLNKLTGFLLFLVPYFIYENMSAFLYIVCFIAAISSLEEFIIDIKIKNYNPNIKSIFSKD